MLLNLEFLELDKNKLKPKNNVVYIEDDIMGEGMKRKKKKKIKKVENASLKQLLANLKLKKERQKNKDELELIEKQKEYYKLLGI